MPSLFDNYWSKTVA